MYGYTKLTRNWNRLLISGLFNPTWRRKYRVVDTDFISTLVHGKICQCKNRNPDSSVVGPDMVLWPKMFVWNWKCSERRIFLPNMKSLWTALLSIWNEACHKMTPLLGCEKIYHCRGKKSRKNSLVVSTILNNISNSLDKTTRGMRASFFKKLHHSAAGKFRQQSSFSYFPSGTRTKDTVLFCTKVVRFDFVGTAFQIDRWYGHDKSVRFVSGRSLFEFD